jgi:hypothetical protein
MPRHADQCTGAQQQSTIIHHYILTYTLRMHARCKRCQSCSRQECCPSQQSGTPRICVCPWHVRRVRTLGSKYNNHSGQSSKPRQDQPANFCLAPANVAAPGPCWASQPPSLCASKLDKCAQPALAHSTPKLGGCGWVPALPGTQHACMHVMACITMRPHSLAHTRP